MVGEQDIVAGWTSVRRMEPPHPALRATFSLKGEKEGWGGEPGPLRGVRRG